MDYGTKVKLNSPDYGFPVGEHGHVNALLQDSLGRNRVEFERTGCWLWVHSKDVDVVG